MFNQYPYLNLNDLNLDYLLNEIKRMYNDVTNFVSINAIKYADPIQWNITSQYEKNTVVIDPLTGTAYISVAAVPSGVALTRTEYWTVVFDLGSFVTRAAQNFTSHWESDTTLTATFSTSAGGWLVWGDVLYKALTNITAGDSYVVDGNIEHFTIEDVYVAYLQTVDNIANSIEAINTNIGKLSDLNTEDKTSIVAAINEVNTTGGGALALIGDLADLTTEEKSTVVGAINEVDADITNIINNHLYKSVKDFGAVGDGVTDDSDAIQAAFDTGYNIYFPTSNQEHYIITKELTITNSGRTFFGVQCNSSEGGVKCLAFTTSGVIKCTGQQNRFYGLNFRGAPDVTPVQAIVLDARDKMNNSDCMIIRCNFFGFSDYAITHYGRGLVVENCTFIATNCIKHYYDNQYEPTGPFRSDSYGDRVFRIFNNRMHGCDTFINTDSSNTDPLYGAVIDSNISDTYNGIMDFAGGVNNAIISNNIMSNVNIANIVGLGKYVKDTIITNNTFMGYHIDTARNPAYTIIASETAATVENLTITNNVLGYSQRNIINFTGQLIGCNISNNIFNRPVYRASGTRAAIGCGATPTNNNICNNILLSDVGNAIYLLRANTTTTGVKNNLIGNNYDNANGLLSNMTTTGIIIDFDTITTINGRLTALEGA